MSKPRVAVQLIVFGERTQTDMSAVLGDVAAAGYDGFEGGAPHSAEDVERMRAATDGRDVTYLGGHCGEDDWADGEAVAILAELVGRLGGGFLIGSGGTSWKTLDDCRRGAEALSEAGRRCRDAGLVFCYHNHAWEFGEVAGSRAIHVVVEQTDPEIVKLCPDVYWIHVGGEEPAQFIARYRDRCPCLHFKDGLGGEQAREFRELGRGCVDLKSALAAALACDPEWIITEQDHTDGDPAESVRISRDYLRTLGL
jgi:sugar phosphate isomerase/epimerase